LLAYLPDAGEGAKCWETFQLAQTFVTTERGSIIVMIITLIAVERWPANTADSTEWSRFAFPSGSNQCLVVGNEEKYLPKVPDRRCGSIQAGRCGIPLVTVAMSQRRTSQISQSSEKSTSWPQRSILAK
jgi:hypothetical protein